VLIRIDGLETHYLDEGKGDPVLLLHGWGASCQSFAGVIADLADRFRFLAVDLPGFGWSQRPPSAWGTGEYARHVLGLLSAVGIERVACVGHSFGGRVAIRLAAQESARLSRLVLVAGAGIRPPRRARYYLRVGMTKLVKRVFSWPVWGAAGQRILARRQERVGSRDYRAAGAMRPTLVRLVNEDLTPVLPAIHTPTLILWGDQDPEVPRRAMEIMRAGIRGSRLVVFEGAGHFPFLDRPKDFCSLLGGFLREEQP
jgi:pimeloyl-ACP methyl ester carboxylesterase